MLVLLLYRVRSHPISRAQVAPDKDAELFVSTETEHRRDLFKTAALGFRQAQHCHGDHKCGE